VGDPLRVDGGQDIKTLAPGLAVNSRVFWASLIVFACFSSLPSVAQLTGSPSDPMTQLSSTFPETVEVKNKGRLLEFCPNNAGTDGTVPGFRVRR
jgi:hypothetical protein